MNTVIQEAEKFVIALLNEKLSNTITYHNLPHTQRVVEKTKEITEATNIAEKEAQLLELAAWFHDTGFTVNSEKHEQESVKICKSFLTSHNVPQEDIDVVCNLILATIMEHEPTNEYEKIIRDADASHLGSKDYRDVSELLRKEWELNCDRRLTEAEWLETNITFLTQNHHFYTDYALATWESRKGKNLAQLLKDQKKLKLNTAKLKQKKAELEFKKNKIELPERGIETMFRVALRNHITLIDIADTKANILLSVNAIIISVALSNLIPKLDNPSNSYLIYPTLIFLAFTVASIVLSVLATRPNVTRGKFTKDDVANQKVNLLFFGNFHQMSLSEFEWAMGEMMQDRDYLYGSLTKDLYFLGLVLNRKYSLLRTTYTVFMIGIVISVIAFGVSFKLYGGTI
ncbi:Pycsar system effector family protein [Psychroserpens sp.]|uniref:Pycsar system effector family protein n=1 Tax=Psychroserpens sp. TaxID=2020870 RepID=UPI001B14D321|nr:Pycsar system effector family protein [Psychroserpens sp.]MBO6605747.1 HD domain-containing protein [Psychroserpens sp.]MBO6630117.1 HD domain-containing protein [Psychroserpens sp.]MBO6652882.1 HD domain-containing protein [Psychroserpens sp.]MBO6681346.1 HD domain-containing protein [Psychroserpens sp.]MBO6749121.1 HD domain-containing protein [Psychroserpens sp.]